MSACCRGARRERASTSRTRRSRGRETSIGGPLVWTFDGPFATCLADMEDTLRRAIVQVGDVASHRGADRAVAAGAASARRAGDAIQPAWGHSSSASRPATDCRAARACATSRTRRPLPRWSSPTGAKPCRSRAGCWAKMNRVVRRARIWPRASARSHTVGDGRARAARSGRTFAQRRRHGRGAAAIPRRLRAADRRDPRRARALRREPPAPAPRDRRARSLRADVDRRRRACGADDTRRAAAPVHPRVQARADQALPREGGDRRAAATRARSTCRSSRGSTPGRSDGRRSRARQRYERSPRRAAQRRAGPWREPFEVSLVGRWSDSSRTGVAGGRQAAGRSPATPLAGRELAVDVDDADGRRRVVLPASSRAPLCRRQGRGLRHRGARRCTRAGATARSGSTTARGG